MSRPAPGRLELVRDFLNTVSVARDTDDLADLGGYDGWLTRAGLSAGAPVTETDRRRAVVLRDGLRALVAARDAVGPLDAQTLRSVRGALQAPALRLGVDEHGAVGLAPARDRHGHAALAAVLAVVAEAAFAGTWPRLKLCRRPTCRWAFYDASPARAAVWCTMSVCGARHKARAYRQRRSTAD